MNGPYEHEQPLQPTGPGFEMLEDEAFEYGAKLIVREPGLDDVTTFLRHARMVLGRDPDCDVRLHSPYVSRRHAVIEASGASHLLSDVESTNGTLVNGAPIDGRLELVHGDEISLSNVRLWYVIDIPADQKTPALPMRSRPERVPAGLLLSVDEGTHSVWLEESRQDVALTPLEFKLMHFLFSQHGRVATRDQIGAAVWGPAGFEYETLYRLVDRVKNKIETDPAHPRFLISHRGVGYSLQAERS